MKYSGLSERQVIESREKHGANVLTPPVKETWVERLRKLCGHSMSLTMFSLSILSLIAFFLIVSYVGDNDVVIRSWTIPTMFTLSTVVILLIGFFGGYEDPLFKILITAFILSMGISIYEHVWDDEPFSAFYDTIGIVLALLFATGVAFFLEKKNEKTFQSLNDVNDDTLVRVVRGGNVTQVKRKDIVVGDIVMLDTGDEVPADCLLLEADNLIVNESSLTGETQANKTVDKRFFDANATYPSNEIFKGTIVIDGYGVAEVFRVGDSTEAGKVFEAAQVREGEPTPLSIKLNQLSKWITVASYVIAALIVVGRVIVFFHQDYDPQSTSYVHFLKYLLQTVMIAVTLIVVAVPEGLPMSVSLSLAFSMRKLMKENTLPRTMHACETMGATSVICTDKTGTLTQNSMRVVDASITEDNEKLLWTLLAVNSMADLDLSDPEHAKVIGNPTEGALLMWMFEKKVDYRELRSQSKLLARLPFSTVNKYMASIVDYDESKNLLLVKGAPELLLNASDMSSDIRKQYEATLRDYQSKGMRTLAVAYAFTGKDFTDFQGFNLKQYDHLAFAGVFAIADPVRPDVPDAIRTCLNAGIDVKIVTGDNALTALEIGRQVGLIVDNCTDASMITGDEFQSLTDEELAERIGDLKILSRARPADKERLVRFLKNQGQVVAVTGDGTNDAPALNVANVGLSMGDGTAVAKEASDMTILDNSFHTIADAVKWGRSLYKNIQRFIMYQMTINVIACAVVLIGAFTGTESPLTVVQMLWVNLIMDTFAALALASLPPSQAVMSEKPRAITESIVNKPMFRRIVGVGVLMTLVLFALLYVFHHADIQFFQTIFSANLGEADHLSYKEQSLFFTIFVMLQFWNLFNAKAFMTGRSAFWHIDKCKGFLFVLFIVLVGQVLIVQLGGEMFHVLPLSAAEWGWIVLFTSPVLLIGELYRYFRRRK